MKKEELPQDIQIEVRAEPGRVVPKLANKVTIATIEGGDNLILSFMAELPNEGPYLIERIVIEKRLAKDISRLLSEKAGS